VLRPCLKRITFFGEEINSFVSDVVAFSKSYAPPVTEESIVGSLSARRQQKINSNQVGVNV